MRIQAKNKLEIKELTHNNETVEEKFQNTLKYWIRYYNQENADNIIEESVYEMKKTGMN